MEAANLGHCQRIFSFFANLMIEAIFLIYGKMMVTSELEFNSFLEDFGQLNKHFQGTVAELGLGKAR